jgi:hypothetical protein
LNGKRKKRETVQYPENSGCPGEQRAKRVTSPLAAPGIAAEILFCGAAAKKIEAESPVFGVKRQKGAL